MNNIQQLFKSFDSLLINVINEILPTSHADNDISQLYSAMRYSSLAPAKHIRPFLLFATVSVFNVDQKKILPICAAIEFIHVYSLIHDDLPSMDNDNIRRGQASCHKKFNEGIAILTGDSLLTLAFEILSNLSETYEVRCKLIQSLAKYSGYKGIIGGQVMDIIGHNDTLNDIYKMHIMKTSSLFSAACEMGAIMGNASDVQRKYLINYGKNLGHAFQIKDDIDDAHQDKKSNNIINILGIDESTKYMNSLFDQTLVDLQSLDCNTGVLTDLVRFIQEK